LDGILVRRVGARDNLDGWFACWWDFNEGMRRPAKLGTYALGQRLATIDGELWRNTIGRVDLLQNGVVRIRKDLGGVGG